jgi:putative inorganic carbon (HCO3(-)) transporter
MNDRLIFYLVLAVVILNIIFPGEVYPSTLMLASVIILILTGLKLVNIIEKEKGKLFFPYPLLLFLSFLFLAFSSARSIYFVRTRHYLFLSATYFLIFFIISNLKLDEKDKKIFLFSLLAATGAVVIYALYQYTVSLPLIPEIVGRMNFPPEVKEAILKRLAQKRVFATFPLPTTLSGFLAAIFPFSLIYLLISLKEKKHLLLSSNLFAGVILVMVLAGSFGGPFVLAGGVILSALFFSKKRKTIIITIGIIAILSLILIPITKKRGAPLWEISAPENPIALRLGNWTIGARIIADRPLLGVGLGNYGTIYPKYKEKERGETQFAHNTPVQWAAEMGIIGGALFTLFIALIFLKAVSGARKKKKLENPFKANLSLTLGASCLILFLHNLIDINYYFPSMGLLGTLIFSMFMVESGLSEEKNLSFPRLSRRVKGVIVTAVLGIILSLIVISFLPFLGNLIASEAKREIKKGEYEKALSDIKLASRLDPRSSDYPLLQAETILTRAGEKPRIADIDQAISLYSKAIKLNYFTPYLHYQISKLYYVKGMVINAYYEAEEARRLYPTKEPYKEWRDEVKKKLEEQLTRRAKGNE